MRTSAYLLSALLLLTACNYQDFTASEANADDLAQNFEMAESSTVSLEGDATGNSATKDTPIDPAKERKMIWTANLRFQVKDVDKSTSAIQEICGKHDAFISGMDLSSNSYQLSNTIQIRVPNNQFHKLISSFKKEATYVDELSVHSDDVTEEFVDIESRLKTKKEVRDRYIEVLRHKAATVEDILAAEEAIRVITEEIEVIEGRLRYLKDQVSLSTIELTMYQKVEYSEKPSVYEKSYGTEVAEGFSNGWSAITAFFLVLVNLWPILLLLILGLWKGKWLWKKLFVRAKAKQ